MREIDFFDLYHQKLISVDICGKPLLTHDKWKKYDYNGHAGIKFT